MTSLDSERAQRPHADSSIALRSILWLLSLCVLSSGTAQALEDFSIRVVERWKLGRAEVDVADGRRTLRPYDGPYGLDAGVRTRVSHWPMSWISSAHT